MNVDSMKWGEFKICDLFEIVGTYTTHPRELMPNGRTPRITCAATNNGLDNTYQNVATEKGGVLSVDSATIGYIAYQENDFIATDHIEKIMLKNGKTMNRYVGLFVKQCIANAVLQKYGYGYKFSQTRIKKQIIELPIDSKGNPNYAFMESCMRKLEQKHLTKIIAYYKNKLLDSNWGGGGNICHPPYLTESSLCYTDSISCHTDFLSCHTDLLPCHTEQSEVSQRHNKQSHAFTTKQNLATFLEGSLMEIAKNELSLESVQWGEFVVGEIFEVKATKNGIDKNKLNGKKGKIPYITRTENQNGIDDFIAEQENYLKNESNVIIIGLDTQTAFYHNSEFYTGQNIQILKNTNLNKYNALFMIQALKNLMTKFNWGGNGATLARLKRGKILLPLDSNNNPHWEFMETFMRELESKHLQKILAYYTHKLESSGGGGVILFNYYEYSAFIESSRQDSSFSHTCNLDKLQWREFYFYKIFHKIKRGKRLIKKHQINGKTPYISSSSINNGVDNFIDNDKEVRKFQNCISLANSGSVGSAFFHQYEFIGSDHITTLENTTFSSYIYLFMLPLIQRLSEKYSFNREINDARIKREKLVLPIDSKGNPNYAFMESFMKNLEQKHLRKIIKYYENKLLDSKIKA